MRSGRAASSLVEGTIFTGYPQVSKSLCPTSLTILRKQSLDTAKVSSSEDLPREWIPYEEPWEGTTRKCTLVTKCSRLPNPWQRTPDPNFATTIAFSFLFHIACTYPKHVNDSMRHCHVRQLISFVNLSTGVSSEKAAAQYASAEHRPWQGYPRSAAT